MELNINLSHFNFKSEDITTEILEQTADKTISKTSYPNGLCFIFHQTADTVKIHSNWNLRIENDGSMTPIEP